MEEKLIARRLQTKSDSEFLAAKQSEGPAYVKYTELPQVAIDHWRALLEADDYHINEYPTEFLEIFSTSQP